MLRFAFQTSAVMANNLLKANFAFHSMAHHSEILLLLPDFGGAYTGLRRQLAQDGHRITTDNLVGELVDRPMRHGILLQTTRYPLRGPRQEREPVHGGAALDPDPENRHLALSHPGHQTD